MPTNDAVHDVVVVGGGNAGLCAALRAREFVKDVVVLEKAPEEKRGGNSFFTGGRMRIPHDGLADVADLIGCSVEDLAGIDLEPYPEEQFIRDMQRSSRYQCDSELIRFLAANAQAGIRWMRTVGGKFEIALGHDDIRKGEKIKLIGGDDIQHYEGGPGLVANLIKQAGLRGIQILYEAGATRLLQDGRNVVGVEVRSPESTYTLLTRAVVLACGGFEASPHLRSAYLGAGWDLAKVRGTEFNTGDGLLMAIAAGARAYGHWGGCHSVSADFFADEFGDRVHGDIGERVSYRFGIALDRSGKRYFDEGADLRAFTYAISGRNLVEQANGFAVQLFDAKTIDYLRSNYRSHNATKIVSNDLREIAKEFSIDPDALVSTVEEFNKAIEEGPVDFTVLDGKCTQGIAPRKSNWALPIDTPPFTAFPVGPAITFTFGGVRTSTRGEVLDQGEHPIPGLYAAGEMVGGIYYHNYPGGSGLASGLVFGLAAGASAGQRARSLA